jgi:ubiquinol-cytochrome c reductase iron-sulfur subunit
MSESIADDAPRPLVSETPRRDFLYLTTGAIGAVGAAAAVWPLIDSMNSSAEVRALSTTEVDLAPIEPGQRITVVWRGEPSITAS